MSETQSWTTTGRPDTIPFSKVALVQVCAYVALAVVSLFSPSRNPEGAVSLSLTVIPVMAIMVVFILCSPLRDGAPGRVIAALAGVCSLACAMAQSLGRLFFPARATGAEDAAPAGFYPQETWAAGVVGLLVVLVLVSFGRQMVREDRSHLIRSLSHGVTDGVAMIAAPGWCFLPDLFEECREGAGVFAWVACAVIVLLAVLLGAASCLWARDANPTPVVSRPYLGVGLLPVMFLGPVVAVASLAGMVL